MLNKFVNVFPVMLTTYVRDFFLLVLKTLQSMLTAVRKGKPINEEEIPPPVALGGKPNSPAESESIQEKELPQSTMMHSPPTNQKPLREAAPVVPNTKPLHLTPPQKPAGAITPETPAISPLTPSQPDAQHSGKHAHDNTVFISTRE